jgi:hypothetical protein
MVDISILLPSLREDAAGHCIDWVNSFSVPYEYEIVLVSPFKIDKPNVVWVEDTGPFRGSVKPINDAYLISKGDFVCLAGDDAPYDVGWWSIIDFVKQLDPKRKYRIAGFNKKFLRLFKHVYKHPTLRRLPGLTKFHGHPKIHGVDIPGWFCADRPTIDLLGGTPFHQDLWAHCGDVDVGLKLHWAGEPVQFCQSAYIICSGGIDDELHAKNVSQFMRHDIDVTNSIWGDIYGKHWDGSLTL